MERVIIGEQSNEFFTTASGLFTIVFSCSSSEKTLSAAAKPVFTW